jgi:hypothetical protein
MVLALILIHPLSIIEFQKVTLTTNKFSEFSGNRWLVGKLPTWAFKRREEVRNTKSFKAACPRRNPELTKKIRFLLI